MVVIKEKFACAESRLNNHEAVRAKLLAVPPYFSRENRLSLLSYTESKSCLLLALAVTTSISKKSVALNRKIVKSPILQQAPTSPRSKMAS
jgi:hypothetical protein